MKIGCFTLTGVLILMVLVLAAFTGCDFGTGESGLEEPDREEPAVSLHWTPQEYPRVDGSTLTIPFSEAIGAAVMNLPVEEARQYILHNTTHNAYVNLIEGRADIIFVTPPSEEELAYAKSMGVELSVVPMMRDGFVFFVNANNPVDGLKLQDIVDIYSGKITNWNQLGGENKQIIAYQREENSGSQTGMLKMVMEEVPMVKPLKERVIGDMGAIIDAVAIYDNDLSAMGYSYYYFVKNMWGDEKIKLLAVDGVSPSDETIGNNSYPIVSTTYLVYRADEPEGSKARMLADFILSEAGQTIVEENGYVPLRD